MWCWNGINAEIFQTGWETIRMFWFVFFIWGLLGSFLLPQACSELAHADDKHVKKNLSTIPAPVLFNLLTALLSAASPQKVLMKAANLTASFEVRGNNVTAIFSWDLSQAAPHHKLTGYQVTWAEVIPTNRHNNDNKLPHSLISQSQILPPVSAWETVVEYQYWIWRRFGCVFRKNEGYPLLVLLQKYKLKTGL